MVCIFATKRRMNVENGNKMNKNKSKLKGLSWGCNVSSYVCLLDHRGRQINKATFELRCGTCHIQSTVQKEAHTDFSGWAWPLRILMSPLPGVGGSRGMAVSGKFLFLSIRTLTLCFEGAHFSINFCRQRKTKHTETSLESPCTWRLCQHPKEISVG